MAIMESLPYPMGMLRNAQSKGARHADDRLYDDDLCRRLLQVARQPGHDDVVLLCRRDAGRDADGDADHWHDQLPGGRSPGLQQRELSQRWRPDRDAALLPVGRDPPGAGQRPAHGLRLHRPEVGRQRGVAVLWGAVL